MLVSNNRGQEPSQNYIVLGKNALPTPIIDPPIQEKNFSSILPGY